MVVRKHRKHALVLFDEEARRAVRQLLGDARQRRTDPAHPRQLRVAPVATATLLLARLQLVDTESGDAFDEIDRNRFGEWQADGALAALVRLQLALERRDERIRRRIVR